MRFLRYKTLENSAKVTASREKIYIYLCNLITFFTVLKTQKIEVLKLRKMCLKIETWLYARWNNFPNFTQTE